MKYKEGDRVRIRSKEWYESNKNKFGKVCTRSLTGDYMICFGHDLVKYCGKVAEIFSVGRDNYALKGIPYAWTDEMIEGLAEYPKIAIQGDPTRGVSVIDALIALGGENDKDSIATTKHACYFIDHEGKIRSRLLENLPEGFKLYTLEEWRKENMEKENADKKELLLGLVETQKGQELIPHKDYEIKQDGDKFYLVKKKPNYPKNYVECCEVLGISTERILVLTDYEAASIYEKEQRVLHSAFRRLLIYRDAYWKIAGEEMGLGKPWKPDWTDHELMYCIKVIGNTLKCVSEMNIQCILAFPIEEMRDAFKENFDPDIEICKEFL